MSALGRSQARIPQRAARRTSPVSAAVFAPSPAGGKPVWARAALNLDAPLALTPTLSQREREQEGRAAPEGRRP